MFASGSSASAALRGLVLTVLLGSGPVSGQGNRLVTHGEPDGAYLEASSPFAVYPAWAFLPMEVKMKNPRQEPDSWQVVVDSSGFGNTAMRSQALFQAKRGESRASALLVAGGESNIYGRSYSGSSNYRSITVKRVGGRSDSSSFRSEILGTEAFGLASTGVTSKLANFDVTMAPVDWRAYCGYGRVFLADTEWRGLAPAARAALTQWTRLGGEFVVVGEATAESGLPATDTFATGPALSFGTLRQQPLAPISREFQKLEPPDDDWAISATNGTTLDQWSDRASELFAEGSGARMSWLMAMVVLGFAILVGPVNVFLLAPARRRHRLFFTTPLISLGAGGLLVLAVVLSDGLGGKGRRYVWLESVPAENTAYVQQHQHSHCGAMFSTGFVIPEAAYFAPIVRRPGEVAGSFEVNLEPDKVRADGEWFVSRRSQSFYLAAVRPGRGRIELGGTPEQPTLTSAFDFPMERCFWLAADGSTWWRCGELGQGTATPLSRSSIEEVRAALAEVTNTAAAEYDAQLEQAIKRPGYFVALAPRVTPIETHRAIKWTTFGIVTGPAISNGTLP